MKWAGGTLILAGLALAAVAYALRKASHDVADSFTDPLEAERQDLIAQIRERILPAGTYGFVPVNSFDQLRNVEGFYSSEDQRAIHWEARVTIRERILDTISLVGFRIRNAFTRRRHALRSLRMACDHHVINSRPSPNLGGQPLQNPSHHFSSFKLEGPQDHVRRFK